MYLEWCSYWKERTLKVSSIHLLLPQIFNMYQPWNSSSQAEETAASAEWREHHSAFMYMSPHKIGSLLPMTGKPGMRPKQIVFFYKNDDFSFPLTFTSNIRLVILKEYARIYCCWTNLAQDPRYTGMHKDHCSSFPIKRAQHDKMIPSFLWSSWKKKKQVWHQYSDGLII